MISREMYDTLVGVLTHASDLRENSVREAIDLEFVSFETNKDYGYQLTNKGRMAMDTFDTFSKTW